jgi:hypothetical protein
MQWQFTGYKCNLNILPASEIDFDYSDEYTNTSA